MNVKVSITLNTTNINKLIEAHKKALEMTTEATLTDVKTSQVVPKDTGMLEDSGFVDVSDVENLNTKIMFDTPYARRLYWHPEYNFRTDKNPNAQGKWLEGYQSGDKKNFVKETYKELFKQMGRGLIK